MGIVVLRKCVGDKLSGHVSPLRASVVLWLDYQIRIWEVKLKCAIDSQLTHGNPKKVHLMEYQGKR